MYDTKPTCLPWTRDFPSHFRDTCSRSCRDISCAQCSSTLKQSKEHKKEKMVHNDNNNKGKKYKSGRTCALIALLVETPEEFRTEGTVGWLPEKFSNKFVAIDFVNFLMLDGATPPLNTSEPEANGHLLLFTVGRLFWNIKKKQAKHVHRGRCGRTQLWTENPHHSNQTANAILYRSLSSVVNYIHLFKGFLV